MKTRRAIVALTATKAYGPGAELAARISQELFGTLEAPVLRLGAKYAPNPYVQNLETALYPQVEDSVDAVRIVTS